MGPHVPDELRVRPRTCWPTRHQWLHEFAGKTVTSPANSLAGTWDGLSRNASGSCGLTLTAVILPFICSLFLIDYLEKRRKMEGSNRRLDLGLFVVYNQGDMYLHRSCIHKVGYFWSRLFAKFILYCYFWLPGAIKKKIVAKVYISFSLFFTNIPFQNILEYITDLIFSIWVELMASESKSTNFTSPYILHLKQLWSGHWGEDIFRTSLPITSNSCYHLQSQLYNKRRVHT